MRSGKIVLYRGEFGQHEKATQEAGSTVAFPGDELRGERSAMFRAFLILLLLAFNAHAETERWYQEKYCTGELEHRLSDGARVDCLTDSHAISGTNGPSATGRRRSTRSRRIDTLVAY